jgi:RNA polymerase sigma-70 factor (ECF subfamily)
MVPDAALPFFLARPPQASSPEELARAARGGDPAAFEVLVKRYERRVYGLAHHHLHDPDEAQDLAQEIFVRLYRNLDRFDPGRPFEPWFWRLAANVALNYGRRRPPPASDRDPQPAAAPVPGEWLPLEGALADLDPGLRLPLLLHYYLDLGLADVATALELSQPAVKSRLHRGRRLLRRALSEES